MRLVGFEHSQSLRIILIINCRTFSFGRAVVLKPTTEKITLICQPKLGLHHHESWCCSPSNRQLMFRFGCLVQLRFDFIVQRLCNAANLNSERFEIHVCDFDTMFLFLERLLIYVFEYCSIRIVLQLHDYLVQNRFFVCSDWVSVLNHPPENNMRTWSKRIQEDASTTMTMTITNILQPCGGLVSVQAFLNGR